ncbi:DUF3850 domain-containing protein [Pseudoalteromonas sp. MEBiC 03485]|uniref:DUF3850 domain-containing protein n=1 Tax=Pseudoalteromonas sp. MEBiC 03485 TaxID=2571103 RepID=UPI00101FF1A9|nr:DUF3850 domain-containing protein [Pseudoalteromonas sp. MEBiC 03485]RZD19837.1 DUF3850 domain-containing protein [Pseudoalteromonas sp. MEBiC 03485]
MTTHRLKIAPEYFGLVSVGMKTAEVRLNDRNYREHDYLYLCEFKNNEYTGRTVLVQVTHVLSSDEFPSGLKDGYCVLSFDIACVHFKFRG